MANFDQPAETNHHPPPSDRIQLQAVKPSCYFVEEVEEGRVAEVQKFHHVLAGPNPHAEEFQVDPFEVAFERAGFSVDYDNSKHLQVEYFGKCPVMMLDDACKHRGNQVSPAKKAVDLVLSLKIFDIFIVEITQIKKLVQKIRLKDSAADLLDIHREGNRGRIDEFQVVSEEVEEKLGAYAVIDVGLLEDVLLVLG